MSLKRGVAGAGLHDRVSQSIAAYWGFLIVQRLLRIAFVEGSSRLSISCAVSCTRSRCSASISCASFVCGSWGQLLRLWRSWA